MSVPDEKSLLSFPRELIRKILSNFFYGCWFIQHIPLQYLQCEVAIITGKTLAELKYALQQKKKLYCTIK